MTRWKRRPGARESSESPMSIWPCTDGLATGSGAELEARVAPHHDVLAELADRLVDQTLDRLARIADIRLLEQRGLVRGQVVGDVLLGPDVLRVGRGDLHRDLVRQLLEVVAPGHEVGLAVHLDDDADPPAGVDVRVHHALRRVAAGLLLGDGGAAIAEPGAGVLHTSTALF